MNPKPNTVLNAEAGGTNPVTITAEVTNDLPYVVPYALDVVGLPASWVTRAPGEDTVSVGANGSAKLQVTLTPPAHATPGPYNFKLRTLAGGELAEDDLPLSLEVAASTTVEAPTSRVREEAPAAPEAEPPTPAPNSPQQDTDASSISPLSAPAIDPKRPVEITPSPVVTRMAPSPPEEPKTVAVTQQVPEDPHRAESGSTLNLTVGHRATGAKLRNDTDGGRLPDGTRGTNGLTEEAPAVYDEPNVLDPPANHTFTLRPGETMVIRLTVKNDARPLKARSYVLEPDNTLETHWLELVRSEVNLRTENQPGEVAVRLRVPVGAEPGDYGFTLKVGTTGGTFKPRSFRLNVKAIPVVKLAAKAHTVTIGPFAPRYADFNLQVERAGNADTAFRIGVLSPEVEPPSRDSEASVAVRGAIDIPETERWRYLFDREMENLRSPSYRRTPQPESVRLRVERKGAWWFGFREEHALRVHAVPVTDPRNGGKTENVLDLKLVRWRLLPTRLRVLAPLLLVLLPFFGGQATDLEIVKPTYVNEDQTEYYIVGKPTPVEQKSGTGTLTGMIRWNSPWFVPMRLLRSDDRGDQVLKFPARSPTKVAETFATDGEKAFLVPRNIRVANLFGGGPSITISYLMCREDTPLLISSATGGAILRVNGQEGHYKAQIPRDKSVRFKLTSGATSAALMQIRTVKRPQAVTELPRDRTLGRGDSQGFLVDGRKIAREEELILLTSDASQPKITIRLIPQ